MCYFFLVEDPDFDIRVHAGSKNNISLYGLLVADQTPNDKHSLSQLGEEDAISFGISHDSRGCLSKRMYTGPGCKLKSD